MTAYQPKAKAPKAPRADGFVPKAPHDFVTDTIIAALENGVMPWRREWNQTKVRYGTSMPHNAATGRAYSGINVFLLAIAGMAYGNDPRWLTYKQAADCGGNVKKGERGNSVVFYGSAPDKKGIAAGNEDAKYMFLKYFSVFNVAQCEGLDESKLSKLLPESARNLPENAAELIDALGAKVSHGHSKACYSPSLDQVMMPDAESFTSEDAYFSTLTHELTHWTGAGHRLKRDMSGAFGSESYAYEELVAELGAAFLCCDYGIDNTLSNSAAYIGFWIAKLKGDNKFIFRATSHARKALDYMGEVALSKEAMRAA